MKTRALLSMCVVVGLLLIPAWSQDAQFAEADTDGAAATHVNDQEFSIMEMAKRTEYMMITEPAEHHRKLGQFVGHWDTVVRVWLEGPDNPPIQSTGSATIRWALGERFIQEEYTGSFLGSNYEGIGFTGYDNFKNMYVSVWLDSQGTAIHTSRGTVDESGKVFYYYGEMDEPLLDVQDRMVKDVSRVVHRDKFIYEMYDLLAGPEQKVMEIVYTRKPD